jgi:hypothetical protein
MKYIVLFLLIVFLVGFSVIRRTIRDFFGIGATTTSKQSKHTQNTQRKRPSTTESPSVSKKVISKEEGEYIDYVEIKD